MWGCNSPFQPKVVYSPQLVVYGIVVRDDSTVDIRVQTNSINPIADPNYSPVLDSLCGTISSLSSGEVFPLSTSYSDSLNFLRGRIAAGKNTGLSLVVGAKGFPTCSSHLTVLDSATIYIGDSQTDQELRNPGVPNATDLKFIIYPSGLTKAIRGILAVEYEGKDSTGRQISGEFDVVPAYQKDTTSYLLRVDGNVFDLTFPIIDYETAYNEAMVASGGGQVKAVVRITQLDATLYDFYSTANGFNDPSTLRTERPIFTNISGGLGFLGSASNDSLVIQVYP